jgi:D-alanyl-D-alanine carboxypeptidase
MTNTSHHPPKPAPLALTALAILSSILFLTTCTSDTLPTDQPVPENLATTTAELQAVLDTWRTDEKITGATMSVYTPTLGNINLASGLSKRSIDPDRFPDQPISPDHPMFVGDITHTLVAATIIQLVLEKSLNLDATIEPWFPEIENANRIKIRNLLQHTSGIPVFYTEDFLDVLYEQEPNSPQSPDDVIAIAAAEGSFFQPGSQYGYSKTNYIVLGRIIELVTGNPLETELHNRFLDPLEMTDTYLAKTDAETIPGGTPSGYEYTGPLSDAPNVIDGHIPQVPEISVISAEWSSGALVSTTTDIIKLTRAIFQSEKYAELKNEMLKTTDHPAQISGDTRIESASGIFTWHENNEPTIGQFGFIYPFSAQFIHHQTSGTTIAVIANEVDSSRNPNSNFQLPVIENLITEVKTITNQQ